MIKVSNKLEKLRLLTLYVYSLLVLKEKLEDEDLQIQIYSIGFLNSALIYVNVLHVKLGGSFALGVYVDITTLTIDLPWEN